MGSWFSSQVDEQPEVPEEGQEHRGRQVIDEPKDYVHETQPLPMPIQIHQDVCTDAHHRDCHTSHLAPCHDPHHDVCHNTHHTGWDERGGEGPEEEAEADAPENGADVLLGDHSEQ
ncbi:g1080 [Coccomyxa elongata]